MSAPSIAAIVPFLDEADHLVALLESVDAQTRRPDQLVLVDDGSGDGSAEIADRFAAGRPWVTSLRRPRRAQTRDRLADAPEYQAFQWAATRIPAPGVLGKLDADLALPADFFATLEAALLDDPRLGVVGSYLSIPQPGGSVVREQHPAYHVRGATKFYRRECYEQIEPVPAILGWDTIDEVAARMHGWHTRSVEIPGGDPLHLRPTGSMDGILRAFSRWGACAYAAGYHPLWIALGAGRRLSERPPVLGALAYLWGWAGARRERLPRADPAVRRYLRGEQLSRLSPFAGARA